MRPTLLCSLLLVTLVAPLVHSQSTAQPPAFAAQATSLYCHVLDAENLVWMNALEADGDEAPYEFYGAPAATLPGVGAGIDPTVEEDFEARIPLSPALAQDIVVQGTVTVQAYIGGGTYTAGSAEIATSLVAGGTVLGEAAAKTHNMAPKQAGQTYDAISWTFDVPATSISAGTLLEWVISGLSSGNNVFLACHEARGRSFIDVPIVSATPLGGGEVQQALNGSTARIDLDAASPSNATSTYTWSTDSTRQTLTVSGNASAGNATLTIVDGANATVHEAPLAANTTRTLDGAAGNWTFTVRLSSFVGNLTIEVAPAQTVGNATSTSTTSAATNATGNATIADKEGEGTPGPGLAAIATGLAAVAVVNRRRPR